MYKLSYFSPADFLLFMSLYFSSFNLIYVGVRLWWKGRRRAAKKCAIIHPVFKTRPRLFICKNKHIHNAHTLSYFDIATFVSNVTSLWCVLFIFFARVCVLISDCCVFGILVWCLDIYMLISFGNKIIKMKIIQTYMHTNISS